MGILVGMLGTAFIVGLSLLMPVGLLYLGWRFVRAQERRTVAIAGGAEGSTGEIAELRERVLRLEERLDDIDTQVGQLAEGQQFTNRLLTERRSSSAQ